MINADKKYSNISIITKSGVSLTSIGIVANYSVLLHFSLDFEEVLWYTQDVSLSRLLGDEAPSRLQSSVRAARPGRSGCCSQPALQQGQA